MGAKEIEVTEMKNKQSPNKQWAAWDAGRRDDENRARHTEKDRNRAVTMRDVLDLLVEHEGIHINYRKKGICVKVCKPQVKDAKNLRALEAEWAAKGVVKKVSDQGSIYSFNT